MGVFAVFLISKIIRFNRIVWGNTSVERSLGVIAAGMENGELELWDPSKILAGAEYVYYYPY